MKKENRMKRFAMVLGGLSLLSLGAPGSACPVATHAVAVSAVAAPVAVSTAAPLVFEPPSVVVQSVPVVAAIAVPAVSVLAVPTVVEEVVKVKSRRHFRTPVRNLLFGK
jgi:hypothetical protein